MDRYTKVENYILQNWDGTVRSQPVAEGNLLALPYPFTVPCITGAFNEMYYWDTYFTNRGLLLSGKLELAKHNCENIAHMIRTYGYMPNGTRTFYIGRSQPPYFALMVADVFEKTGDKKWLAEMFEVAQKEYDFWMTKRIAPNGLNRYGSDYADEYYTEFITQIAPRIELDSSRNALEAGRHYVAEAESGWDFNPRFKGYCLHCNPVDLNSLLYRYECLFADFSRTLGQTSTIWQEKAAVRAERMHMMEDPETGVMYDYNYVTNCRSEVMSAASFWPYWVGIKTEPTGISTLLKALELPYGITATVPTAGNYQWGYGKAWAPLADVVIMTLDSLGLKEDALRVARKYADLIANSFEKTGGIWEKYDAVTGEVVQGCEYETPQMMGWTAGAFLTALEYIKEH